MVSWIQSLAASCALAVSVSAANAQVLTVTTSANVIDIPTNATLADLPGPDGVVSMREALRVSDNLPGQQTIGFAIPQSDWPDTPIEPGVVLVETGTPFLAFDSVTIDGTTQTAFTGDTNPNGNELALARGINLNGDASEIFGVHGGDLTVFASDCVVRDNTGRSYISVFNGSGNVIHDNDASTIRVMYGNNNTIVRNTTERVRISGLNAQNPAIGNAVGGPSPADRNFITGWGNVGEHGSVAGTTVELYLTNQTLIQNNWIGTTPDGMSIGNTASTTGIGVYTRNHNLMIRDNLIAIGAHWGGGTTGPTSGSPIELSMNGGGDNVEIYGNTLGLNALGQPLLGGEYGVFVGANVFEYGGHVTIGGPNPGEGNIIAGHEGQGILMQNAPGVPSNGNVRISGNSVYGNGDIAIDLMPNTLDVRSDGQRFARRRSGGQ